MLHLRTIALATILFHRTKYQFNHWHIRAAYSTSKRLCETQFVLQRYKWL